MTKFVCPICGHKDNILMEQVFMKGELIECPKCMNILRVKEDYGLEDFKDILIQNQSKRRAESKLNEPDSVCVKTLEDVFYE